MFDVYRWLGIVTICSHNLMDHVQHLGFFVSISKTHRIWMVMICCSRIWIIWKDRNNIFFFQTN